MTKLKNSRQAYKKLTVFCEFRRIEKQEQEEIEVEKEN